MKKLIYRPKFCNIPNGKNMYKFDTLTEVHSLIKLDSRLEIRLNEMIKWRLDCIAEEKDPIWATLETMLYEALTSCFCI